LNKTEERKLGFIDVILAGARKGINIWFNALLPGVVLGYAAIEVLKVTGILNLVAKLFTPVMALFGLPGEAMMALLTSFMALSGGCAAAASLAADGVINAKQATIMLPMILIIGSQVQFIGRVLAVADVPSNKYWVNCVIGLICAIIAGLVMRVIA
jgi:spore maturation protein SpmB